MELSCSIEVAIRYPGWSQACPAAESLARAAAELALSRCVAVLKLVWQGPVELGISLIDAAEQQRLNRDYRGKDATTNVLAFPAWEPGSRLPPDAPLLLGDVVLALETVEREAIEQDKPIADHLRHLVVHGILHLLGYDHMTPAEAAAMKALEISILAEMGISDPYRDPMSLMKPVPVSHERFRAAR